MIHSIKIDTHYITISSQSLQESEQLKQILCPSNNASKIHNIFGDSTSVELDANPRKKYSNIIISKADDAFTYDEVNTLMQSTKMIDSKIAIKTLQKAKTKLPNTSSIFLTENKPIFNLVIKNDNIILSPLSMTFSSIDTTQYANFIDKLNTNLAQYRNARFFVEYERVITISGLHNIQDMIELVVKQFMEYGLEKAEEKFYISEFINASVIKELAIIESSKLQDLMNLPSDHPIKTHKEPLKAARSIFGRLSKSGATNSLSTLQMTHLREASQLTNIFKYAPPAITNSLERLLHKMPSATTHAIKNNSKIA